MEESFFLVYRVTFDSCPVVVVFFGWCIVLGMSGDNNNFHPIQHDYMHVDRVIVIIDSILRRYGSRH